MVAGKVKLPMGLQKSPSNPKPQAPPSKTPSPSPSTNKGSQKTVFTRSFGVYFPRSSAQVQPRPPDVSDLLRLVEELREREYRLKTEILEQKLLRESVAIVPVLENEITSKTNELERFAKRMEALEAENERLIHEGELLREKLEEERREKERNVTEMGSEIAELKQKLVEKERMEIDELSSSQRFQGLIEVSVRSNLIKNLSIKKVTKLADACTMNTNNTDNFKVVIESHGSKREESEGEMPRHSTCSSEELPETSESVLPTVRSRPPRVPKPPPKRSSSSSSLPSSNSKCSTEDRKSTETATIPPPPPPPPPKSAPQPTRQLSKSAPPPPPPPVKGLKAVPTKVRRVPEVVEFYHSLMRRDSRRDSGAGVVEVTAASTRDLVGEIENRSAHLHAIKTDVETQGDFIRFLIKEVENAAFTEIEDVVSFVKWLDDELSYLVDERAVLKHFDWPEQRADALREAAFEYCDLKKLESEASSFKDDARQACAPALKKMQALFEKLEHGVYNLSRLRESTTNRFKSFNIPVDWMLENGCVSQIKLASVKLAMKYMKRVSAELETVGGGPEEEELIVQGVRFAFRVHQFAGGFDVETMRGFEELRDKARSRSPHGGRGSSSSTSSVSIRSATMLARVLPCTAAASIIRSSLTTHPFSRQTIGKDVTAAAMRAWCGKILDAKIANCRLICSSGIHVEEIGH
ncbi:hypothetical protein Nepgr_007336 [Nepenthes gracilis]|uniref:Protein CHUP1, chloroplastic n=1 Tax=Nepenthes gracilis TaxID=150966 RepID=A0AAD3S7E8_NEPGR|nr:hypothetical protein Nepgr_007336 [Nepenthes gracilis]